jgi:hypothetical protein
LHDQIGLGLYDESFVERIEFSGRYQVVSQQLGDYVQTLSPHVWQLAERHSLLRSRIFVFVFDFIGRHGIQLGHERYRLVVLNENGVEL